MSSPGKSEGPPILSAIIVTFNAGDDLGRCVGSLLDQGCAMEIIVVDNGSPDGSVDRARTDYPLIRVVADGIDDGFAGGANRGAAVACADTLLFLNPDVLLEPGCADALVAAIHNSSLALVCGPMVMDPSGGHGEFGVTIDYLGDPVGLSSPGKPLWLSATIATSRRVFDELGGFDATFFMFCEDMDFCWRALLHGYDVQVVPGARILHRGGASTSGGYVRAGRIEVTASRIALRERNTLSTLVRCGPVVWVLLVASIRLVRMGFIAVVAMVSRRPDLARGIASAVMWNIRRFPQLVRQRREIPATPAMRRSVLRDRMRRDFNALRVLFRHGWPHFVDRAG